MWIFERYLENAQELLDNLARKDADFANSRFDVPIDSYPHDSLVSKALGKMCFEIHDDDPQLDLGQLDRHNDVD
jgi:hypothetical protein